MTPQIRAVVDQIAARYGLSPELLAAQVMVESSGLPDAFRPELAFYKAYIKGNPNAAAGRYGPLAACSYGLLQIMFEVAAEDGFTGEPWELFDPFVGLDAGAKHLAKLLARCGGDYHQALAQYNGGTGGNMTPPYRTEAYAQKVFDTRDAMR